jgi:hypothetical protein
MTLVEAIWDYWEDYRAGMYRSDMDPWRSALSEALLGDPDHFYEVAREMIREWPNSAHHNLVNMWSGRNAWLGQAACCYAHGATAADTKAAWGLLTNDQQRAANAVARTVQEQWERGKHDAQTVLDL